MDFQTWMKVVNQEVENIAYISVHDLADQPFKDWFDDGFTPKEAAEETLQNEGWPI